MKQKAHEHLKPTLGIETRILGWGAERIALPIPDGIISVADLIRLKVAAEWAAMQNGERSCVGRESISPELLGRSGTSRPAGLEIPGSAGKVTPPASMDEAERAAIDGYRAGWYIILVDGEEPGGLDTRLRLSPDTLVAFVRVYPLPDAPSTTA